jgi:hypothetical protein
VASLLKIVFDFERQNKQNLFINNANFKKYIFSVIYHIRKAVAMKRPIEPDEPNRQLLKFWIGAFLGALSIRWGLVAKF